MSLISNFLDSLDWQHLSSMSDAASLCDFMSVVSNNFLEIVPTKIVKSYVSESTVPHFLLPRLKKLMEQLTDQYTSSLSVHLRITENFELASKIRLARNRQRESCALSEPNSAKSAAQLFRNRSSSKRGYEIPPLLNEDKNFVLEDSDKAKLFSAFFANHLTMESEPVPTFQASSLNVISTIDFALELIR
ncbi:unnamed protein product [Schistocephalus solidus]|uniref:Uncharacterized protein n=1 Tax=Schistocephalus solidus TaxID=70667 RepID=A0A183SAD2_SCHSO|nr:unnamed protein product [Schistocephalus solidus]